jgi:hypothetical protein
MHMMPHGGYRRFLITGFALAITFLAAMSTETIAGPAQMIGTPIPAAECTVQPRSFNEIADLASTPAITAIAQAGDGAPADEATAAAITGTIRLAVACANANDPLRALALFTDRYVAERFGPSHPDDLGSLNAALSRTPVPADEDDLLTLVDVRDIVIISDGRAEAVAVTENRSARYVDRLVLELVKGRWLIDAWTAVEAPATPTA